MRLLLLIAVCWLCCQTARAEEAVDYYAKIKANYAQLAPFSAKVSCTIVGAEPTPVVTFERLIACDTDKYRCVFLDGDRAPQQWFRTGKVWYRSDPNIPSYYKSFADSMPGASSFDPGELGSSELQIPLVTALSEPPPELIRRDKNEIVLRLASPVKVKGQTWTLHLSTTNGLPIKSQYASDGKKHLEIVVAYREAAHGAFFPHEVEHTWFDTTSGAWTQKMTYRYELTASKDRALGEKLLPPAVPPGAIIADYTVKRD